MLDVNFSKSIDLAQLYLFPLLHQLDCHIDDELEEEYRNSHYESLEDYSRYYKQNKVNHYMNNLFALIVKEEK